MSEYSASYDLPDSNPWGDGGAPTGKQPYGQNSEDGFYDTRDDLAGGTDSRYNQGADGIQGGANWASAGDNAPVVDAAPWSTSGTLSQADLAS